MRYLLLLVLIVISQQVFAQSTKKKNRKVYLKEAGIETRDGEVIKASIKPKKTKLPNSVHHLKKNNDPAFVDSKINFLKANPRKERSGGVNMYLGGPSLALAVSIDQHISPNVNIELGLGLLGPFGGINYFLVGKQPKNWTPFLGAYLGRINDPILIVSEERSRRTILYFPLGIRYVGNDKFSFGAEIASGVLASKGNDSTPVLWGALKFGLRFH